MKLVLASNNPGKLREIREIMEGTGVEVLSQREAGCDFEAEETGETFMENARIKARAAMRATGLPAVADDSGLEVRAMDGAPGVHSARFAGDRSYDEVCRDIQARVEGHPDRRARYCCALVCCFPDGRELSCFATTEGEISRELRGTGGFGYDPMFLLPDGRTMAELSEEEKNAISHRGRAFRELVKRLKDGECDADK
ncbi:MAG: RdgB/HAM1 family non-canonical purine NTP pyrophosphatase [Oscillospiraceae bacterium]|nr:RdgB/HAM1 family non-canonical purine NTP pyrophosphatase [Oscillospiraceae bacterium]